jgi:hypothetical protein
MAVAVQGFMKLEIDTSATETPNYESVPGVFNVSGGGKPGNKIDSTDFDTPVGETESIPGPRQNSPYSFSMHYEPGNAIQKRLFTSEDTNAPVKLRIKFGTGAGAEAIPFSAVPTLTLGAPVEGKVTYDGSVEPLKAANRETVTP